MGNEELGMRNGELATRVAMRAAESAIHSFKRMIGAKKME